MLKYNWVNATPDMTEKEKVALDKQNREQCFMYTIKNIDEIVNVFNVQLEKDGHPDREKAVNEIVKYLVKNRYDKYKVTGDKEDYAKHYKEAESLVLVSNIIEAVNNNDKSEVEHAIKELPHGDENNEDKISWNAMQFAYWIMSDEAREQNYDLVRRFVSDHEYLKSNKMQPETAIQEFASLKTLENLASHNALTRDVMGIKER